MAVGNRNQKGRPTDLVRHAPKEGSMWALCGCKRPVIFSDVKWNGNAEEAWGITCKNCIKKLKA